MLSMLLAISGAARAGEWFEGPLAYWEVPYGLPPRQPPVPPQEEEAPAPEGEQGPAFDWADYRDPRTEVFWREGEHVPPAPLLEVIRAPTPDNIAQYRQWTARKLEVAAWVSSLLAEPPPAPVSWEGVTVVYFYASGCGVCAKNTPEVLALDALGADVMPVHLDRPSPAYPSSTPWSDEMGQLVEVTGTPTWVLIADGQRHVVRGYAPMQRLETELRTIREGRDR